jgi:hypothetical protein
MKNCEKLRRRSESEEGRYCSLNVYFVFPPFNLSSPSLCCALLVRSIPLPLPLECSSRLSPAVLVILLLISFLHRSLACSPLSYSFNLKLPPPFSLNLSAHSSRVSCSLSSSQLTTIAVLFQCLFAIWSPFFFLFVPLHARLSISFLHLLFSLSSSLLLSPSSSSLDILFPLGLHLSTPLFHFLPRSPLSTMSFSLISYMHSLLFKLSISFLHFYPFVRHSRSMLCPACICVGSSRLSRSSTLLAWRSSPVVAFIPCLPLCASSICISFRSFLPRSILLFAQIEALPPFSLHLLAWLSHVSCSLLAHLVLPPVSPCFSCAPSLALSSLIYIHAIVPTN